MQIYAQKYLIHLFVIKKKKQKKKQTSSLSLIF